MIYKDVTLKIIIPSLHDMHLIFKTSQDWDDFSDYTNHDLRMAFFLCLKWSEICVCVYYQSDGLKLVEFSLCKMCGYYKNWFGYCEVVYYGDFEWLIVFKQLFLWDWTCNAEYCDYKFLYFFKNMEWQSFGV